MPQFAYKAVRANGELLEGEMEAADEAALIRKLQEDGYIPIKSTLVQGASRALWFSLSRGRGGGLSQNQIMHLTRELATLLDAGMTLDRSLQILADLTPEDEMGQLMNQLREMVQSGSTFSAALEDQGGIFSPLYINMVKAGEAGGMMQVVLARLADYLERSGELRESIRSALTYPLILFVVVGLSLTLLLVFVLPQFNEMFADMGQALPLPTRIVITFGDLFRGYWWLLLGGGFLFAAWFRARLERPEVRRRWDVKLLGWPLLGDLLAKIETARFTRTLATLLENGLPLLAALNLVKDVISNSAIKDAIGSAADSLRRGRSLSDPLLEQKILPPMALQMIKVGEESGSLEPMLNKVADIYDQEVRSSVKRLLTLLEPLLIVGLGVIVVGIIGSIMLAILSANELVF